MGEIKTIQEAMAVLELPMSDYTLAQQVSLDTMQKLLEGFKDKVKNQRKFLVKKYHPDLPTVVDSGDRMKLINSVVDELLKMKVVPRRQPQVRVVVRRASSGASWVFDGTSSTTGYF